MAKRRIFDLPPPFGSPALFVKGIKGDQGSASVISQNWRDHTFDV